MDQNSTNDTYTLYAMLYKDDTIEYSFEKLRTKQKRYYQDPDGGYGIRKKTRIWKA